MEMIMIEKGQVFEVKYAVHAQPNPNPLVGQGGRVEPHLSLNKPKRAFMVELSKGTLVLVLEVRKASDLVIATTQDRLHVNLPFSCLQQPMFEFVEELAENEYKDKFFNAPKITWTGDEELDRPMLTIKGPTGLRCNPVQNDTAKRPVVIRISRGNQHLQVVVDSFDFISQISRTVPRVV